MRILVLRRWQLVVRRLMRALYAPGLIASPRVGGRRGWGIRRFVAADGFFHTVGGGALHALMRDADRDRAA